MGLKLTHEKHTRSATRPASRGWGRAALETCVSGLGQGSSRDSARVFRVKLNCCSLSMSCSFARVQYSISSGVTQVLSM